MIQHHSIDPRNCAACAAEGAAAAREFDERADLTRIRSELRDRLDRCDPFDHEAALRQLAHDLPDEVNEALDTTGAPQ